MFKNNCCDGIYNSFDVHFTKDCDNACAHCIDMRYSGVGASVPDVDAISNTIISNCEGYDDVLFLGGEPCLYLDSLIECVERIKSETNLKLYVTTAIPKKCYVDYEGFEYLINIVDGINLSVQHHDESIADKIRGTRSLYDRQFFYSCLPLKHKIRINLNIVKPWLYTRGDIEECIRHYDTMGFNEIKLSEIQHGKDFFVSFEDVFRIKMSSPFYGGCQSYVDPKLFKGVKTPVLLKRSCFLCEETLKASFMDGLKMVHRAFSSNNNKYGVVYGDGTISNGWR